MKKTGLNARRLALFGCTLAALTALAVLTALTESAPREDLTVLAAASLTDALSEAGSLFEEAEGVTLHLNFASSSTLARQIEAGVEADVFLSANVLWMDYLQKRGFVAGEDRVDLLGNRLALVVPKGTDLRVDFSHDSRPPLPLIEGLIAVGEMSSVPAGIYARQALESLGWMSSLESNLVSCDNVRSALMLVSRAETAGGIVYLSDAAGGAVEIAGLFPEETHDPIVYPAAVLKGGRRETGHAFLIFLAGAEASSIFKGHGFRIIGAEERL